MNQQLPIADRCYDVFWAQNCSDFRMLGKSFTAFLYYATMLERDRFAHWPSQLRQQMAQTAQMPLSTVRHPCAPTGTRTCTLSHPAPWSFCRFTGVVCCMLHPGVHCPDIRLPAAFGAGRLCRIPTPSHTRTHTQGCIWLPISGVALGGCKFCRDRFKETGKANLSMVAWNLTYAYGLETGCIVSAFEFSVFYPQVGCGSRT